MKNRVLVVEDNANLRRLIAKSLEHEFEVLLCKDAEEAYEYLGVKTFFAAIIDLNLPGMSGYEFISEIKTRKNCHNPFIIMISARNDFKAKLTAITLGAISFIEKPFDIRYLRGLLNNLLGHVEKGNKLLKFGSLKIDNEANRVQLSSELLELTEAEKNILLELIKNKEETVARERLFLVSGKHKENADFRVVDAHISSLRKKLKKSEIKIKSVYGKGYQVKKAA